MKSRLSQSPLWKSKSHTSIVKNNNPDTKRYQRMKFMGIPVSCDSSHLPTKNCDLKMIVAKISSTSILSRQTPSDSINKFRSKGKQPHTPLTPEDVKLIPKVPEFDCTIEERERTIVENCVLFTKAQPRGTNARNLRVDKSLPWIEDELNAAKAKFEKAREARKSFANALSEDEIEVQKASTLADGSQTTIKKTFHEIIATKLQDYKALDDDTVEVAHKENDDVGEDGEKQSSVESTSSLSSVGTNFTNDSGSCVLVLDQMIPKSQMNLQKKFLVSFNAVYKVFNILTF